MIRLPWQRPKIERPETLVVYTAIFGTIPDQLAAPPRREQSLRFVCFTDRAHAAGNGVDGWELRPAAWTDEDPRRTARYHKVLSHVLFPDAGYTIWHDGNIRLRVDPWTIVDRHLARADVAAFTHSQRECVYEELEACIALEKDAVERMRPQIERYRREGYPARHGLSETGMLVRRHSPAVRAMNESWWREIDAGSVRDQLSFDVAVWRHGLAIDRMPGVARKSPYLKYRRHR